MRTMKLTAMTGAAMVVLSGAATAKVMDLGWETGATPYERYMDPVKEVLRVEARKDSELDRVGKLLATARGFRYRHNEAYVARNPEVTEATRTGDCKDKSLWLLAKMGSGSARFVIGKLKATSTINHAWVYWQNEEGDWFILDPTHRTRPLSVSDVRANEYLPLYSYASNSVYVHDASRPVMANRRPVAVAQAEKSATEKVPAVENSRAKKLAAKSVAKSAETASKADVAGNTSSTKLTKKIAKASPKTLPVAEMEQDNNTDNDSKKFAARLSKLNGGRSLM